MWNDDNGLEKALKSIVFFVSLAWAASPFAWQLLKDKKNYIRAEKDEFIKNGQVIETSLNQGESQKLDTVFVIPLNMSKEFRKSALPLIKKGKVKVIQNKDLKF